MERSLFENDMKEIVGKGKSVARSANESVLTLNNEMLGSVRVARDENGEPLFCLSDVCKILEIQNAADVAKALCREFELPRLNIGSFDTGYGVKEFNMIDEPQLYYLLNTSKSKHAKPFRLWVNKEFDKGDRFNMYPLQKADNGYIFDGDKVDVIVENDTPYFKLTDIEKILGLSKGASSQWLKDGWFDEDEVKLRNSQLGGHPLKYVAESGLYRILNRTNSLKAKPFERWVSKEVLPSIRKTGGYGNQYALPRTYKEALIELVKQVEKTELLEAQAKENAPKVEAFNALMDSKDTIDLLEFSKAIGIGRTTLFRILREKEIFIEGKSFPYQRYIDAGYFRVVECTYSQGDYQRTYIKTMILPKGQEWLVKKLKEV